MIRLYEFDAAFQAARRAAYGQTMARLQHGSSAAAMILMKVMLDQNTPASTRVRAAEIVVNEAAKVFEIEVIEACVSECERTTGASTPR
jgi:hypothetical protein